jgi:antitoxin ParD1/3/4
MNVSLTPELEKLVQKKVDSGLYNNASEVVREALRLLKNTEELRRARLKRLRAALAKGEADILAGRSTALADAEAVKDFLTQL